MQEEIRGDIKLTRIDSSDILRGKELILIHLGGHVRRLLVLVGVVLGLGVMGHAVANVNIAPWSVNTGPTVVTCSTSAWTSVAPSSGGTFGTFVKNLDTNSTNVEMIATSTSAAPSAATTTWQWNVTPSGNAVFLANQGGQAFLWCVSVAGANSIVATEVKTPKAQYP